MDRDRVLAGDPASFVLDSEVQRLIDSGDIPKEIAQTIKDNLELFDLNSSSQTLKTQIKGAFDILTRRANFSKGLKSKIQSIGTKNLNKIQEVNSLSDMRPILSPILDSILESLRLSVLSPELKNEIMMSISKAMSLDKYGLGVYSFNESGDLNVKNDVLQSIYVEILIPILQEYLVTPIDIAEGSLFQRFKTYLASEAATLEDWQTQTANINTSKSAFIDVQKNLLDEIDGLSDNESNLPDQIRSIKNIFLSAEGTPETLNRDIKQIVVSIGEDIQFIEIKLSDSDFITDEERVDKYTKLKEKYTTLIDKLNDFSSENNLAVAVNPSNKLLSSFQKDKVELYGLIRKLFPSESTGMLEVFNLDNYMINEDNRAKLAKLFNNLAKKTGEFDTVAANYNSSRVDSVALLRSIASIVPTNLTDLERVYSKFHFTQALDRELNPSKQRIVDLDAAMRRVFNEDLSNLRTTFDSENLAAQNATTSPSETTEDGDERSTNNAVPSKEDKPDIRSTMYLDPVPLDEASQVSAEAQEEAILTKQIGAELIAMRDLLIEESLELESNSEVRVNGILSLSSDLSTLKHGDLLLISKKTPQSLKDLKFGIVVYKDNKPYYFTFAGDQFANEAEADAFMSKYVNILARPKGDSRPIDTTNLIEVANQLKAEII